MLESREFEDISSNVGFECLSTMNYRHHIVVKPKWWRHYPWGWMKKRAMGRATHLTKFYAIWNIGNWRLTNKSIMFLFLVCNKCKFKHRTLLAILTQKKKPVAVHNEKDTPTTCKKIEEQNPAMIRETYVVSSELYIGQYFKISYADV